MFSGHDFGGYKEPLREQQWPIIRPHVQKFFHVGPACTCNGGMEHSIRRPVFALEPRVEQLQLNHGNYGIVLEPQYENPSYRIPHFQYEDMYYGDDYGGYNMDYPHPAPPKPSKRYQQDAFIDLAALFPEYGARPEQNELKQRQQQKSERDELRLGGFEEPSFDSMSKQYEQELFRGIGDGYKQGISGVEAPGHQTE